ncbi:Fur family transcriptional regulator [Caloramator sp. mosi_1]|uniref:Fur family transcriptional regulator n=1 Tax=Caloramator sp. mosi_1 TaxID=3023090 RepID=UPI002361D666|nr:Fur family transcriptional regulator [Caloramator sp. mosi_1]WDC83189.1 Fur family transcriptional regulator [Caloramator sp. mosi_1]
MKPVQLEEILKSNGYKMTNQRRAILEVLCENIGKFLSAEDILNLSKNKCPQTNFSTVYRNLEILEQLELVHKTNMDAHSICFYEIIEVDNHHHHIICTKCGKTKAIDFCPLDMFKSNIENEDFELLDHKLELYGICSECKNKPKK